MQRKVINEELAIGEDTCSDDTQNVYGVLLGDFLAKEHLLKIGKRIIGANVGQDCRVGIKIYNVEIDEWDQPGGILATLKERLQ